MATKIVGSNFPDLASDMLKPTKVGYGQNQFGGASSDLPGEHTTSGFLPGADLAGATAKNKQVQQRTVSAAPMPPSFGMDKRSPRNS